jgi:hypothetical protein
MKGMGKRWMLLLFVLIVSGRTYGQKRPWETLQMRLLGDVNKDTLVKMVLVDKKTEKLNTKYYALDCLACIQLKSEREHCYMVSPDSTGTLTFDVTEFRKIMMEDFPPGQYFIAFKQILCGYPADTKFYVDDTYVSIEK